MFIMKRLHRLKLFIRSIFVRMTSKFLFSLAFIQIEDEKKDIELNGC